MDAIEGHVDPLTTYPMVKLALLNDSGEEFSIPAMVDTGYNGEVILPDDMIRDMGLTFLGTIDGEIATGDVVKVRFYDCRIQWFDDVREITVHAIGSDNSLLGTLMLSDCELNVNFKDSSVRIQRIE